VAAIVAARGLRRGIHAAPDTQAGPTAWGDESEDANAARNHAGNSPH
jgi:hypothetical protein